MHHKRLDQILTGVVEVVEFLGCKILDGHNEYLEK